MKLYFDSLKGIINTKRLKKHLIIEWLRWLKSQGTDKYSQFTKTTNVINGEETSDRRTHWANWGGPSGEIENHDTHFHSKERKVYIEIPVRFHINVTMEELKRILKNVQNCGEERT